MTLFAAAMCLAQNVSLSKLLRLTLPQVVSRTRLCGTQLFANHDGFISAHPVDV